jgi:hypothetical protein
VHVQRGFRLSRFRKEGTDMDMRRVEYGSEVWSPHTKTQLDQIENVKRRVARWIKLDYGQTSSVTDMLHSLNFRKTRTQMLRRTCIDARLSLL